MVYDPVFPDRRNIEEVSDPSLLSIFWVGYTQEFPDGDWRNGYYHSFCEATDPYHALIKWYDDPLKARSGLQVWRCDGGIRTLVYTVP